MFINTFHQGIIVNDYCIEIRVSANGITVAVEDAPEQEQEPNGEPVENIDAAVEKVRQVFAERSGDPNAAGDAEFSEGFASGGDTGRGGAVDPAQRFA